MVNRATILAGVWERIVEEWNAGNIEKARSLERFYTALERRFAADAADAVRQEAQDPKR